MSDQHDQSSASSNPSDPSGRSTRARGPPPLDVPHVLHTSRIPRRAADAAATSSPPESAATQEESAATSSAASLSASAASPGAAASSAAAPTAASHSPSASFFSNPFAFLGNRGAVKPPIASSSSDEFEDTQSNVSVEDLDTFAPKPTTKMTTALEFGNTLRALEHRTGAAQRKYDAHVKGTTLISYSDAQLLLDDLKGMALEFTALHTSCFSIFNDVKDPGEVHTPLQDAVIKYDVRHDDFLELRSKMSDLVRTLTPISGTGLKPPKLALPTFKGVHGEWPAFKSAFKALVTDSTKFTACEKLRLLKEALKGPAEDNVKDLQATDGNWPIAWARLAARYDSPREAAHAAVRPLLDLPALMSQNGNGIHKLLATLRTTRAQIEQINLGAVTEAEVLYSHFVLARLDSKTIKEFNQTLPDNDMPHLEALTSWLEKYAKSLDLTNEIKHSPTKPGDTKDSRPSRDRRDHNTVLAIEPRQVTWNGNRARSPKPNGQRGRSPKTQGRSASHQQRREVLNDQQTRRNATPPIKASGQQHGQSRSQSPRPQNVSSCNVCSSSHHRTLQCPDFLGLSIAARRDWVRTNNRCFNCMGPHSVKDCTSKYTCSHCHKKHHSLLHVEEPLSHIMTLFTATTPRASAPVPDPQGFGVLPTAIVTVTNAHDGEMDQARCLLDSGAERCFITKSAVRRLGLQILGQQQHFVVAGGRTTASLGYTILHVRNHLHPAAIFQVNASVLPQITCCIPGHHIDTTGWDHITTLPLADPTFQTPSDIDVLLGTGFMDEIMRGKKISGPPGTPSAYLTEFGYVLQGRVSTSPMCSIYPPPPVIAPTIDVLTPEADKPSPAFDMQKFWEIEDLPQQAHLTPLEQECQDHFDKNTIRLPNGRFQVKWPFVASPMLLGSSYKAALSRWLSMERKLQADPALYADYHGQIEDYLEKGQLEPIPPEEMFKTPHYWIPHHAVFKPSSTTTKMRIVFDASAKTSSGKSVNALLAPGPVIQPPLFDHLLNFRFKAIGMTADIAQMYRQILVDPSQRDFARIIWRKSPSDPLQYLRHTTIPFGLTTSPYLAVSCTQRLAREELLRSEDTTSAPLLASEDVDPESTQAPELPSLLQKRAPHEPRWTSEDNYAWIRAQEEKRHSRLAAEVLLRHFYVDDCLISVDTVDAAINLKDALLALLATAHMDLRKWSSNSIDLLDTIPAALRATQLPMDFQEHSTIGTLGMSWNPATDTFQYKVFLPVRTQHTKRSVLSDISKVFDPLGLIAPAIIPAKVIMQRVWTHEVGWDDPLPSSLLDQWLTFIQEFPDLEKITIPRWIGYAPNRRVELHGFCDASEKAYAAVIYLRTQSDDQFTCHLIASKSRVAPVKITTIPRLELQGAVLLADLMPHISRQYNVAAQDIYFWTDSTICLHWIYSHPSKWKNYVANRVTQIQKNSTSSQWSHVISEDNPADCSSRGLSPSELQQHTLWWTGPDWLKEEYTKSVFNPSATGDELITHKELKPILHIPPADDHYLILCLSRISSWKKAVRVVSLLLAIGQSRSFRYKGPAPLASALIAVAELKLTQLIQAIAYPNLADAIHDHYNHAAYRQYRPLKNLHPFVAKDGIIRVGGRLQRSELPFSAKHPALLPGSHPLVRALILHAHQSLAHAGRLAVHNHLRQKFWIPNALKSIKSVIDKCLLCFRYQTPPSAPQLMGQLPAARVNVTRPFLHTGVDFFGPYELRNFTGRGGHFKVWVALFTCLATRAIHLELVSTLSQYGFLLAFRRFISRRGRPTHMYSDNGGNFTGANKYLQAQRTHRLVTEGLTTALMPDLDLDEIKWRFNPPSAPSQGGVWESCVKLVKTHLKKLVSADSLTWEQFESILLFIEGIVNSRPLTPVSDDPHDLEALTPAHFLVGVSPTMLPEDDLTHCRINRLDHYQLVIRRQQDLWKRWQHEYITALQKRPKWQQQEPNLQPDDMVIVMDDDSPPYKWLIGRVKEVHPGKDGLVRVTTIEHTSSYKDAKGALVKTFKDFLRPIHRLAKIPIEADEQDPRYQALPYPNQEPAVTTIVRPNRLQSVPVWQFLFAITALTTCLTPGVNAQLPNASMPLGNTTDGPYYPQIDSWTTHFVAGCLMVFSFVGVLGNLCTILAIIKDHALRRNHVHWFVLSLCCSDLLFSSTSLPMTISRLLHRRWVLPDVLCNISGYLLYGNIICTLINIVTITLNRYIKIVHFESYHRVYTDARVRFYLLLVWMFSFGAVLPPLLGIWGTFGPPPSDASSCTILPDSSGRTPKPLIWIFGSTVPITVILCCYVHILLHVCRTRYRVRKLSDSSHSSITSAARRALDSPLTRMICYIVGGYLIAFEPVLILNWIDSTWTLLPPGIHLVAATMAWSTSWHNLAVYITTNRDYRAAYVQLFSPRSARSSSSPRTTMKSMMTRTLALLALLATTMATHLPKPDLASIAPACSDHWETHHIIPECTQTVQWLHIQNNGSVCSRGITCMDTDMISPDAKTCITQPTPCAKRRKLNLDHLQCQTTEDATHVDRLQLPPFQSPLCSVSGLTIRDCPSFTESFADVPIVILGKRAYPLDVLRIVQTADVKDIQSYSCQGTCTGRDCAKGQCIGDPMFCEHFLCLERNNELKRSSGDRCDCTFNSSSLIHQLSTDRGTVTPTCWGTMHVPVRQIQHQADPSEFLCEKCTIDCTTTGLRIYTPGRVSRYIRASKNPGHVAVVPTTTITDLPLSHNMLATSGKILVQIWFDNFDIPSTRELACPRIPVCDLIQCHMCIERWLNVSCYDKFNWIFLVSLGATSTMLVLSCFYLCRFAMNLSWYMTWPLRFCLRHIRRRRNKKPSRIPRIVPEDDVESGTPLLDLPVNPIPPYPVLSRPRNSRHRALMLNVIYLMAFLATSTACSNFAMLSAATTDCDYSKDHLRTCHLRLNTRLVISPIGQQSCLRLDDSRSNTLGTLMLTTKSISMRCEKQLLYFVPRVKTQCNSVRQCFNILKNHECTYNSCSSFGPNDTIEAFGHTTNTLGWSACVSAFPGCFWPSTSDCHFIRTSIVNPTGQTYSVYNCPEWIYAAEVDVQFHIGSNTSSQIVTLYAGKTALLNKMEFALISATVPPTPVLNDCILSNGYKMALIPCNKRREIIRNRLGEIQCNSLQDAKIVSNRCYASFDLIKTQIDDNGIRCTSDFVDPELLLQDNPLPVKLAGGVLLPLQDSVHYEVSGSAVLEVQVTTDDLIITKEIEDVQCDIQFIKLTGCYGCLGGAILFLHTQSDVDATTANLECPDVGFFTPLLVTSTPTTSKLIMKVDHPDVSVNCVVKCGLNSVPLHVVGHLQYLQDNDMRRLDTVIRHEPSLDPFSGFSLFSLYGSTFSAWIQRALMLVAIILLAYITISIALRTIVKKLV